MDRETDTKHMSVLALVAADTHGCLNVRDIHALLNTETGVFVPDLCLLLGGT